jgi:hypothetical protein
MKNLTIPNPWELSRIAVRRILSAVEMAKHAPAMDPTPSKQCPKLVALSI